VIVGHDEAAASLIIAAGGPEYPGYNRVKAQF
jgi:hypothetical protein